MKKKTAVINIEPEILEELIDKVQKALPEKDAELIIRIILTLKFICEQLERKNVQIKRLLKRIFGIKTEKTKKIIKNNNGSGDNTSEDNDLSMNNNQKDLSTDSKDSDTDSSKNQKKEEEEEKNEDENSKKGHGRNGIDKYTSANVIEVPHQSLKKGDPCLLCPKGKVYPVEPGVFTFIKGNPPVNATIYRTEKFRCNLCGAIFEAKLPDYLPQETKARKYYDETSKTILIMLRYGYGLPLYRMAKKGWM